MPREATITFDQVASIADAIKTAGGKATSRAIREQHGSGSLGTIQKLLQQWEAGQVRQVESTLTLPPALQRSILDFMSQEMTVARAELEGRLADAQQATQDLATENERQAEDIEELQAELANANSDRAALEGKAGQLEADLAVARDEIARERAAAEAARTELAKAQLRLEAMPRLEADLDAVRTDLAQERNARAEADRKLAGAESRADGLAARLADAAEAHKLAIVSLESQLAELKQSAAATVADLRAKLDKAEAYSFDLGANYHKLQAELYTATANATREAEFRRKAEDDLKVASVRLASLQPGASKGDATKSKKGE